jgi:hypothetical protein
MKKTLFLIRSTISLIIITLLTVVIVSAQDYEITVTGTLFTPDIDEDIPLTLAGIMVQEEEEYNYYLITPDDKGKELYEYIEKTVTITGTLSSDKYENQWITVKIWKLVKTE